MYHRFDENKYPSTNIKIDVFKKQLELIEKNSIEIYNPSKFDNEFNDPKKDKRSGVYTSFFANSLSDPCNSTDRGSIKNLHVINTRKNMCKASIWLTINGQKYRIDRKTIKKNAKGGVWAPTTLKFFRVDKNNNELDDLTEEQRREILLTLLFFALPIYTDYT